MTTAFLVPSGSNLSRNFKIEGNEDQVELGLNSGVARILFPAIAFFVGWVVMITVQLNDDVASLTASRMCCPTNALSSMVILTYLVCAVIESKTINLVLGCSLNQRDKRRKKNTKSAVEVIRTR